MKKTSLIFKRFCVGFLFLFSFIFFLNQALANDSLQTGLNEVNNNITLGNNSPYEIVIKIIQFALSLLSLIAVIIILYAGFLWMTSGGSEDKIKQAKSLLRNGLIGLLLILASWGIEVFIFNFILGVTNNNATTTDNAYSSPSFKTLSLGAIGSCSLESVFPPVNTKDVPRNTAIMFTFKETISPASICASSDGNPCACNSTDCNYINSKSIHIFKTSEGDSCNGNQCLENSTNLKNVLISLAKDGKTFILKPQELLGSDSGLTEYNVRLSSNIKKQTGESIFSSCSSDYFEWSFEVTNKLDLTPPQILESLVFPPTDNEADEYSVEVEGKSAKATIQVIGCPNVFTPALVSVSKLIGGRNLEANLISNYKGDATNFTLVLLESGLRSRKVLRLFSGENILGEYELPYNEEGDLIVDKYDYVNLEVPVDKQTVFESFRFDRWADTGNSWVISVRKEVSSDHLLVGSNKYTFISGFSVDQNKNNVGVNDYLDCSNDDIAELVSRLNSSLWSEETSSSVDGSTITITATKKGSAGNNLNISTDSKALKITPFTGGEDKSEISIVKNAPDQAMNAVLQVSFNEAINPMTVVGSADEMKDYVRVVNADGDTIALGAGASCEVDMQCLSYKCEANQCAGDYLSGTFSLSSNYKTLEFKTDNECGTNSCGEKMYCLPARSHLAFELRSADPIPCYNNDCQQYYQPFSKCLPSVRSYMSYCNDESNNIYPQAHVIPDINGITDLAFNVLDGNANNKIDVFGYSSFYNTDDFYSANKKDKKFGDSFKYSFFISDKINSDPPKIDVINPQNDTDSLETSKDIYVKFNNLMMNSTLRTGSIITGDAVKIEHKLLNLKSFSGSPLGYWLDSSNISTNADSFVPDSTQVIIKHSDFFNASTYSAQIGSGVKNIYQNCFKPSSGPGCEATPTNTSCCFGSATNSLNDDGGCQ